MMKGNEKDCICAKDPEHNRYCDTYRLREFLTKAAAILMNCGKVTNKHL